MTTARRQLAQAVARLLRVKLAILNLLERASPADVTMLCELLDTCAHELAVARVLDERLAFLAHVQQQ